MHGVLSVRGYVESNGNGDARARAVVIQTRKRKKLVFGGDTCWSRMHFVITVYSVRVNTLSLILQFIENIH